MFNVRFGVRPRRGEQNTTLDTSDAQCAIVSDGIPLMQEACDSSGIVAFYCSRGSFSICNLVYGGDFICRGNVAMKVIVIGLGCARSAAVSSLVKRGVEIVGIARIIV